MAAPLLTSKVLSQAPNRTIISRTATILLATGLGIGTFFLIREIVRKIKRNQRAGQALQEGNPSNYAIRLKMAFENDNAFGWGTDEEALFQTLEEIPSIAMMRKVQRAYRDLHNSNLALDLKNELTTNEYAIALEIINSKK